MRPHSFCKLVTGVCKRQINAWMDVQISINKITDQTSEKDVICLFKDERKRSPLCLSGLCCRPEASREYCRSTQLACLPAEGARGRTKRGETDEKVPRIRKEWQAQAE